VGGRAGATPGEAGPNLMMRVARTPSTKKGQYFTTSSHMVRIKP